MTEVRDSWRFTYQGERVGYSVYRLDRRTAKKAFDDQIVRENEYAVLELVRVEVRDGYYRRKSKPGT